MTWFSGDEVQTIHKSLLYIGVFVSWLVFGCIQFGLLYYKSAIVLLVEVF